MFQPDYRAFGNILFIAEHFVRLLPNTLRHYFFIGQYSYNYLFWGKERQILKWNS